MADEAVSNSGPLIHLAQINKFNLLKVFTRIFIPQAVYDEVCIADKPGNKELHSTGFIEVYEVLEDEIEVISRSNT